MYTDLFSALLNHENRRGHPILSAMLYSFCPTSARWWIAGADPQLPFDPVWQAIKDWSTGASLAEQLDRYGFGKILDVVRRYVAEVEKYRKDHVHVQHSPELSPFFKGGHVPKERRFESDSGIQNLGGDWKNLFVYVRTWAFLLDDWRKNIHLNQDTSFELKIETILLTLPDYRQPVQFEALVWHIKIGHVEEARIGVLVQGADQDLLRFGLLSKSGPHGNLPWPNLPQVYALNRETGEAEAAKQPVSNRGFLSLVKQLAEAAQAGPYPPLNALQRPSLCKGCGYQALCYRNSNLAPHVLAEK